MSTLSTRRAGGANLAPDDINWQCVSGIVLNYRRIDVESLVEAGLIGIHQVPGEGLRCNVAGDGFSVRRLNDGSVNADFDADYLLARSISFRRFLGGLLADARLSLVRDEACDR